MYLPVSPYISLHLPISPHISQVPIKLGFKDVIFVMEDVDAASKVVQRRDGKTGVVARLEDRRFPSTSPDYYLLPTKTTD